MSDLFRQLLSNHFIIRIAQALPQKDEKHVLFGEARYVHMNPMHRAKSGSKCTDYAHRRYAVRRGCALPDPVGRKKDRKLLNSGRIGSRCDLFPPSRRGCSTDRHRPLAHGAEHLDGPPIPASTRRCGRDLDRTDAARRKIAAGPVLERDLSRYVCLSPRVSKIAGAAH